jgi:hypothetical protein
VATPTAAVAAGICGPAGLRVETTAVLNNLQTATDIQGTLGRYRPCGPGRGAFGSVGTDLAYAF